jgi:hypothetical protein
MPVKIFTANLRHCNRLSCYEMDKRGQISDKTGLLLHWLPGEKPKKQTGRKNLLASPLIKYPLDSKHQNTKAGFGFLFNNAVTVHYYTQQLSL